MDGIVGRMLRTSGVTLVAAAMCLAVATSAGWVPAESVDPWIAPGLLGGLGLAGAGVLLSLLSPLGRMLRRSRCVRCGAAIERGQTYCIDHLRETVAEYRDLERGL